MKRMTAAGRLGPPLPTEPGVSQLSQFLDQEHNCPAIVGLEYIVEQLTGPRHATLLLYECTLCRTQMSSTGAALHHLLQSPHKVGYLRKHFPQSIAKLWPYMSRNKNGWFFHLAQARFALKHICRSIEERFGRLEPTVVLGEPYRRYKSMYADKIAGGPHFEEDVPVPLNDYPMLSASNGAVRDSVPRGGGRGARGGRGAMRGVDRSAMRPAIGRGRPLRQELNFHDDQYEHRLENGPYDEDEDETPFEAPEEVEYDGEYDGERPFDEDDEPYAEADDPNGRYADDDEDGDYAVGEDFYYEDDEPTAMQKRTLPANKFESARSISFDGPAVVGGGKGTGAKMPKKPAALPMLNVTVTVPTRERSSSPDVVDGQQPKPIEPMQAKPEPKRAAPTAKLAARKNAATESAKLPCAVPKAKPADDKPPTAAASPSPIPVPVASPEPKSSVKYVSVTPDEYATYKRRLNKLYVAIEAKFLKYQQTPQNHPLYDSEWKSYWVRRAEELRAAGTNVDTYDFTPDWTLFWVDRARILNEDELKRADRKVRRDLRLALDGEIREPSKPTAAAEAARPVAEAQPEAAVAPASQSPEAAPNAAGTPKKRSRSRDRDRDNRTRDRNSDTERYRRPVDGRSSRWSSSGGGGRSDERDRSPVRQRARSPSAGHREGPRGSPERGSQRRRSSPAGLSHLDFSNDPPITEPVTVISVLRLLSAFEDMLGGSLGPKVVDLLSKAVALEKVKANLADDLLMSAENSVLLGTIKEKLIGLLLADVVDRSKVQSVRKVIAHVNRITLVIDGQTKLTEEKNMAEARQNLQRMQEQQAFEEELMRQRDDERRKRDEETASRVTVMNQLAASITLQGKVISKEQLESLTDVYMTSHQPDDTPYLFGLQMGTRFPDKADSTRKKDAARNDDARNSSSLAGQQPGQYDQQLNRQQFGQPQSSQIQQQQHTSNRSHQQQLQQTQQQMRHVQEVQPQQQRNVQDVPDQHPMLWKAHHQPQQQNAQPFYGQTAAAAQPTDSSVGAYNAFYQQMQQRQLQQQQQTKVHPQPLLASRPNMTLMPQPMPAPGGHNSSGARKPGLLPNHSSSTLRQNSSGIMQSSHSGGRSDSSSSKSSLSQSQRSSRYGSNNGRY